MFTPNRIGTPLSPSATTVEVHAVDSYENAPAHQVAHAHYVIDMTNPDELRRLIAEVKPQFIVPEIEAVDTNVLDDCEAHGVTVIPTARATQLTMNREGIRRLAAEELGLPTSAYSFASNPLEFKQAVAAMGFPCVVKPVMSSSGKGQSIVRDDDDIAPAWDYAQSGGRVEGGRVIVERFVDFDYEITLLTVRSIDPRSGKTATWFCEPIGHLQRDGDYVESWQPIPMPSIALENARSVAARITNALGGHGLFGVELFVSGDDVYFSEVSPRPHDTGLVTLATQRFSEFELHARAILGLPIDVTLTSPGASAVIYGGIDAAGVTFDGVAEALAVEEADIRLFGKPISYPTRRMGVALATAEDAETARDRAQRAASAITVF